MITTSIPPSRRSRRRSLLVISALPAVVALLALTVPSRSLAQAPTFNALVTTSANSSSFPAPAAAGDFNGDGKMDALVTDGSPTIHLMLGNGNGTFTERGVATSGTNPGPIQAVDFNGDGRLDAVTVSNGGNKAVTVLINTGNDAGVPQFTATNYLGGNELRSVSVGDLNGDGRPDFIVGNAFGQLKVYVNDGSGAFTAGQALNIVPSVNGAVGPGAIVDFNGDGKADYAVASNQSSATNVFFGNGNGTLQTSPTIISNNATALAAADLNADGKMDLVEANTANQVLVYLNNGSGTFSGPAVYSSGGTTPLSIAVADMNRDGKLDVVVSNFGSKNVGVLLGNGSGVLGAANLYTVGVNPYEVLVRDFNGDAVQDIFTVNRNDRNVSVLLNSTPAPVAAVFGSGISAVTAWDPIIPATAYADASALSTPTQTVGPLPNDPRWTNAHPAFVFPLGTHPWESTPPMDFNANWINAWANGGQLNKNPGLESRGPNGQSWTKYSTTVTGQGSFVLQFLADNVSWIYLDGALVGYQDWNWESVGTGRYTINLNGAGPHELVFIIWDGGGLAGGKFRLETTQSFIDNGGGQLPPPPPPSDTTPPEISAPSPVTAEATSAAGAIVTFTATANDAVSGSVPVTATPPSGSEFPLGISSVALKATDAAGNTTTAGIIVHVQDTTAPALTVPGNVTAEAASAAGAAVSYPAASATDAVTASPTITYSAGSGSTFALGTTTVHVSATDGANNTSTGSFTVTVQDTTAPALTAPANQLLEATSAAGAVATFSASATDLVTANPTITYGTASGSTFALGTTTVHVSATDGANNTSTGSFTVTVQDTTAPALTVPANQLLEATSAAGAVASFSATATDAVTANPTIAYSAASGSTFALGTTTVNVTATDAAGNTRPGSFTVTVRDTTAPTLTVPANQVLEATSAAGAVATFSATATDAVTANPTIAYSAASGSTFALGTTTVNVTATDAANNTRPGSFTITVRDTTAPTITSLSTNAPTLWPPDHKMVAITVSAVASDLVGVTSLKIISVTSNEPDNGLGDGDVEGDTRITGDLTVNLRAERSGKGSGRIYTITVEARDAAGNKSTQTCTVSVPVSQGKK